MSRRKQTKPQHLHSDSEGEEDKTPKDGKVTDGCEPQPSGPSASPEPGLVATSPHQGDTQTAEKQEGGDGPSKQDVASESSDPHNETASRSSASEISRPPKKRGRPLSLSSGAQRHLPNFSKSHSAIATALVLAAASPRRQSSRLHPPLAGAGFLGESGGKKMSHRTCEYCGVVKPTPAALQRHVRKHTGEKPFVCKVCQKAYKAKRSLHCHQITNHPELLDGTPNIASTSDLDPAAASATVSPSTSHLLRETLETRRMARKSGVPDTSMTVPEFVKSLMARSTNGHSDEKVSAKPSGDTSNSPSAHSDHAKAACAADAMQDLSINVSTLTSSLDDADVGGEETGGDLAKRSCPHCQKVFIKPSDLKRHLMVHTGERPFVCHYCNKGFKQPGSLNYHMKATHNLDIPLSQGLEERYLRLKTRSAMRNLAAMEGWTPRLEQEGGNGKSRYSPALPSALPSASCADAEVRSESTEPEGEADHSVPPPPPVPQSLASCSSYSPDFKQGLQRQTSVASEGSWSEDRGPGSNVIDVELPQFAPLDGSTGDAVPLPPRKVQMAVKKETVLFTRLEGACSSTGQEMQVFRCCLCDKVCASLFYAFSHLALHLESARTPGFECRLCSRVFKSQLEMADHFWRKHNVTLNDLDLQNNNHNFFTSFNSKSDEDGMKESDALEESEMKEEGHLDDHNNNNGNHINKEYTSADSIREESAPPASQTTPAGDATNASDLPSPTSPQPQSNLEDSCVKFTDGLEPSEPPQYPTKGTHRCPKCSKCYMTQFLLDRHVAFHTRQSLIEAAMKSGAKVNGAQKDLLLQPPPVLPQDSEMFLRLKELSTAQGSEQGKESGESGVSGEQQQVDDGSEPSLSHKGLSTEDLQNGLFDTKALLEKEGIQGDVTVVMPSDPDLDEEGASPLEPEARSEIEDAEMAESSEIRCAPKRQLIPYRKETVVTKSRRKSSLPTKFRSAAREPENSALLPASSSSHQHPSEQQPQESTASGHAEQQELSSTSRSCSNSPKRLSESPAERSSESPSETDQINKEFQREMLRAQQSSYLQTLHAAFGNVPSALLGSTFPGNGFPPASSLAMAAAGYLRPFSALPGRSPFSLHGSASVSNSNPPSKARSRSPPSPASGNEEDQAEDLSLSSGSATSPPRSASASLPSASALPANPEKLVGYPRVLWETPLRSRGEEESPSPPPLSTSVANGKLFNPVWHTLSSEDLSNSSTTDGRKVTSLSRTHSRLYVVNQPVDRERICKPTVLPDGRTVFRCIFCHKDFLSYSDINRHMDFHEDIRPYKCNFCDYYARTNSQLKVHMMRHQGIREYCCRLCNYKGVTQSDLNRHMKSQIHLLKSRNECTKCGEGFVTTKNLEKHLSAGCDGTHKMDVKESS